MIDRGYFPHYCLPINGRQPVTHRDTFTKAITVTLAALIALAFAHAGLKTALALPGMAERASKAAMF